MKRVLSGIASTAIILFCLWHMMAIGLYTLPDRDPRPWVQTLRLSLNGVIRPYLFWTSQWQNWGVFSQASLSRVVAHTIEVWDTDRWVLARRLDFHSLPWWRNEPETSLLRSMEAPERWPVLERYLQEQCRQLGLSSGTFIRMGYPFYDMPLLDHPQPYTWWKNWEPQWQESGDTQSTQCHGSTLRHRSGQA